MVAMDNKEKEVQLNVRFSGPKAEDKRQVLREAHRVWACGRVEKGLTDTENDFFVETLINRACRIIKLREERKDLENGQARKPPKRPEPV